MYKLVYEKIYICHMNTCSTFSISIHIKKDMMSCTIALFQLKYFVENNTYHPNMLLKDEPIGNNSFHFLQTEIRYKGSTTSYDTAYYQSLKKSRLIFSVTDNKLCRNKLTTLEVKHNDKNLLVPSLWPSFMRINLRKSKTSTLALLRPSTKPPTSSWT